MRAYLVLGVVMMGVGASWAMAGAPATGPATTSAPAATRESDEDKAVRVKLEETLKELTSDSQAFGKVVTFLGDNAPVAIDIHWDKLAAAGINKNTPVTVSLRQVTIREALVQIIAAVRPTVPVGVGVSHGKVVISTEEELKGLK